MTIQEYFNKLNKNSQDIFNKTITDSDKLGQTHHISSFITEFSEYIIDNNEKITLKIVASQIETATLNLVYGMYRQAYSSLRLAFELGLGLVYFSINKLEHVEWLNGKNDIKWTKIIDKENGIISKRFSNAFFPELTDNIIDYNNKAKGIYRRMSEFVHGNNDTWTKNELVLKYSENLVAEYFDIFKSVSEILIFALCCRYLKSFSVEQLEQLSEFLLEEMKHVSAIREYLGGVKEIKI